MDCELQEAIAHKEKQSGSMNPCISTIGGVYNHPTGPTTMSVVETITSH